MREATNGKEPGAQQFFPAKISIRSLCNAARECEGCSLFKNATQTVFGAGRASSYVVLVGEQPGNEEDREGKPFVGPAGRILDEAMELAGIDRTQSYVTNVVKHFKWVPRGKKRIHDKPSAREIAACLPWLKKEIEVIKPKVLVCLGATAAQALLGRHFKVSVERGRLVETAWAPHAVATIHPSAILRQRTSEERRQEKDRFIADLKVVAGLLKQK